MYFSTRKDKKRVDGGIEHSTEGVSSGKFCDIIVPQRGKIFLNWALDVLYSLLQEEGEGLRKTVYDPTGMLDHHGKFGNG